MLPDFLLDLFGEVAPFFALNKNTKSIDLTVMNRDHHIRMAEHKDGDDLGLLMELSGREFNITKYSNLNFFHVRKI